MKKILIAAIIGVAATASTFAQGFVFFNNIDANTDANVTYGAGTDGPIGTGVLDTYTAGLYYAFGTVAWNPGDSIADPAANGFTLLASATATFNSGALAGPGGEGYFTSGGFATIPGYTSGAISFVVVAYEGANYLAGTYRGHSGAFTLSSIATGQAPVSDFGPGLQPFTVLPVPEPSTFALAGLGLASLVIFRRRK